ncbi:MAG: hypothetical protein ACJ8GN_22775 [Longimicrobiaceae bacterium]
MNGAGAFRGVSVGIFARDLRLKPRRRGYNGTHSACAEFSVRAEAWDARVLMSAKADSVRL